MRCAVGAVKNYGELAAMEEQDKDRRTRFVDRATQKGSTLQNGTHTN